MPSKGRDIFHIGTWALSILLDSFSVESEVRPQDVQISYSLVLWTLGVRLSPNKKDGATRTLALRVHAGPLVSELSLDAGSHDAFV